MATAVATTSVASYPSGIDSTQRHAILFGTITVSASPATYVTGGLQVSFNTSDINASDSPVWVQVKSTIGSVNTYQFQPTGFSPPLSPPLATGKVGTLRIFVSGTELADGAAIPAGVSGDVIAYRAEFNKGQ